MTLENWPVVGPLITDKSEDIKMVHGNVEADHEIFVIGSPWT